MALSCTLKVSAVGSLNAGDMWVSLLEKNGTAEKFGSSGFSVNSPLDFQKRKKVKKRKNGSALLLFLWNS
jgi:hypothetical protein